MGLGQDPVVRSRIEGILAFQAVNCPPCSGPRGGRNPLQVVERREEKKEQVVKKTVLRRRVWRKQAIVDLQT